MKTITNILKIDIKLALILSVLLMLWSLESNANTKSKNTLDSIKKLEGRITITKLNKENELLTIINKDSYIEYRKYNIYFVIPRIEECISETNYKYYQDYLSSFYLKHIIACYRNNAYEKSEEEILLEFEKIHLKGKVGILDNLVPIMWI